MARKGANRSGFEVEPPPWYMIDKESGTEIEKGQRKSLNRKSKKQKVNFKKEELNARLSSNEETVLASASTDGPILQRRGGIKWKGLDGQITGLKKCHDSLS